MGVSHEAVEDHAGPGGVESMVRTLARRATEDKWVIARRMREHERRARELHAAGRFTESYFEAESAEILARWLTDRGDYPGTATA